MVTETRVGHNTRDGEAVDHNAGRASWDGEKRHIGNTRVGDAGWLGNPFEMDEWQREEAIVLYRTLFQRRLDNDPEFRAAVCELAGDVLGCWCRTLDDDQPPCHADVIAEHADRLAAKEVDDDGD